VDYFETDEHKAISKRMTPAKALRHLRTATRMTLQRIGDEIGVSMARVNDYESGRRAISKEKAKKLSELFHIPVEVFI
jgi:transcriptional regulator with XRE-family HTH domain